MKRSIDFLTVGLLLLIGTSIFISSCQKEDPPVMVATSMQLVAGGNQISDAESTLAIAIEILVLDQEGNAFGGADVNFDVSEGSVSSGTATTDASGKAITIWTLGSTAGTQTLTVTANKAIGSTALSGSPLLVTATANQLIEATSIEIVSGEGQSGDVESTLPEAIIILVKDQEGNPFQGASVNFAVGEGSVSTASETTDASGNASTTWTLGTTEGTQTLTVSAFKSDGTTDLTGSPLQFNTTATGINAPTTVTDFDGNVYQIVQIGNQTWMAENLKVTHYSDGTEIPLITDNTSWANLGDNDTQKAYCFYDNDENSSYGALYTSAAAMNGNASSREKPSGIQGVCPDNWHLPSDLEWWELRSYLGMATAAGQMKTTGTISDGTGLWQSPNTGATNASGFSALPGGDRRPLNGTFRNLGYGGAWLTTYHTNATDVLVINITYLEEDIGAYSLSKSGAYSVRCVKD